MCKSIEVYYKEEKLGDVVIYPQNHELGFFDEIVKKKIVEISDFSQSSERCQPLAVLHTISSGICFKMESNDKNFKKDSPLRLLYSSCIQHNKTAVIPLGAVEIHLVAMSSRNGEEEQLPCFWGFKVAAGLYDSCLVMLNLRCLSIVFDLDETLIVANTMRSFEDKIEALQRRMNVEVDPRRAAGIMAEVKRYEDDKSILKQYLENDQVVDNGRVITPQYELVPALSNNHRAIHRPVIRLQEKNIILTRINPQIRDTSVLVRLRPAWEDLRSYLIAKGRKRFEVYVCTMAEKEYALEMWRLLDPESKLISTKQLLNRIVSAKSGSRKSLSNVFQDGSCHPKMGLVVDDRLEVWEEKDQHRVHVVPAFAPYFAPKVEEDNGVPVLCAARNVACNVRGGFFKELDGDLQQRISEVSYEDNLNDIPSPDVHEYLVSMVDILPPNGNRDSSSVIGVAETEVARRLKEVIAASSKISKAVTGLDPTVVSSVLNTIGSSTSLVQQPVSQPAIATPFPSLQQQAASLVRQFGHDSPPEPMFGSSARDEGELPEPDLDQDTRRRLLIFQHGQDPRRSVRSEPQYSGRTSKSVSAPRVLPHQSWPSDEEIPLSLPLPSDKDFGHEYEGACISAESPVEVLQRIAMKCGTKVKFRSSLVASRELQFSVEAWLAGAKMGEGFGRTRREAQYQAAEQSIKNLADIYISGGEPDSGSTRGERGTNGNGFVGTVSPSEMESSMVEESLSSRRQNVRPEPNQFTSKRLGLPRSIHRAPSKRPKSESPRVLRPMSSSSR